MKTSIRIFSLAVLALAMAACSNDMEQPTVVQPAPGNAGEGIPFSATISTGSATTRALKEEKGTIISTWAKDEQVALIHNGVVDVMTAGDPDETTGNVTITGTLSVTPKDGDDVTVVYPASAVDKDKKAVKTDLLTTQDGTLTNIATDLNLRQSDGAKLIVGKTATLNGTVTLANQIAIVKFSLSDGNNALAAKQFVIKDGSDNVLTTVTPLTPASDLYVAMAPATNAAAFKFEATVGDFTYTYEKSGVILEASTYYQSPIKMTISKKAGEISFATTSISKTFGDEPFINEPTITGDGTVTYSSSDTKVAEVNATTGEVTIKGDGVAIIKATVTDGPTYTYATNEASYTLGVGTATMTVTAEGYSGTYDGNTHGITVKAPDGATVKYGTTADDYDLEAASPSYSDAGTYTVYYKVTMPGFTIVTGSATVTIEKASGTISFDTATPKETLHTAAADNTFTQEVAKTGDGTVTYTISDNTCGATIDASTGKVTFTQAGSVTITATVADGTNYTYATKTATYTLSVSDTTDGSGGVPDNDDYTGGGNPF